jgi:hypothetical protein
VEKPIDRSKEQQVAGLCDSCAHSRRVESSRGSIFYLCELSAANPAFAKYPRLPVVRCSGFNAKKNDPADR